MRPWASTPVFSGASEGETGSVESTADRDSSSALVKVCFIETLQQEVSAAVKCHLLHLPFSYFHAWLPWHLAKRIDCFQGLFGERSITLSCQKKMSWREGDVRSSGLFIEFTAPLFRHSAWLYSYYKPSPPRSPAHSSRGDLVARRPWGPEFKRRDGDPSVCSFWWTVG